MILSKTLQNLNQNIHPEERKALLNGFFLRLTDGDADDDDVEINSYQNLSDILCSTYTLLVVDAT